MSIVHAVEDDTGIFTCQTPARYEHSVHVVVKVSVSAEVVEANKNLFSNDPFQSKYSKLKKFASN